ncbi:lipopolysaccharide transport periplasmic protein LptA [Chromatiales bacterium (ex Bugula neritina AB1)]|nr:lipopolysaccharide transport periplasmic protein LptA [Chromatiales bacterium (ex Bugula neritina AB1)]
MNCSNPKVRSKPTPATALSLGLLLLILFAQPTLARQDDQKKPISVKADTSVFDERAGTQELAGNVEITQGSMSINADSIKIELKNGSLYRITGSGQPIRFQQLSESNELMRGQSNEIIYNTETADIIFRGDARFEKPGQKFTGHLIEYNMNALTFKAEGRKDNQGKGRVNIILQPGKPANDR